MRRLLRLLTVAAVATVAACGGAGTHSAALGIPSGTGGSGYAAFNAVPNGQPYIMSIGSVCLSAGSPVKIDKVTATNSTGHMDVFDWGVRYLGPTDHPMDYVNHVGYLHKVMPGFNQKPITVSCSHPHGAMVELDVNVKKTTDLAVARNFIVHYQDGQELLIPVALIICAKHCDNVKPPSPW